MLLHLKYGSITLILAARRWPALPASCAAVAAVLAAGGFGASLPGWWEMLSPGAAVGLVGLVLAGGAGLLAFHLAGVAGNSSRATARGWRAPLAAALVPVATIPAIGVAALVVPLVAAIGLRPETRGERAAAIAAVLACAAAFSAAHLSSPETGCLASLTMLAAAWFLSTRPAIQAANDNPSLERMRYDWMLPDPRAYARQRAGTRDTGNGE